MYWVGIDLGSTVCKIIVMDENKKIVNKKNFFVESNSIKSIHLCTEYLNKLNFRINGIGVTGSGRNLLKKAFDADISKTEILAHAAASIDLIGNVGTIIEIGGQDSKLILLKDNMINSFEINTICSSGTGSFLSWQAKKLALSFKMFNQYALSSTEDIYLSGKCSVFLENEIINLHKSGVSKENIAMAICYNLVQNYINNFINGKELNEPIVFQGGVSKLECMRYAFMRVLKKQVIVPKYSEYMGAYGVAILVKNEYEDKQPVQIKKIITTQNIIHSTTICDDCDRHCNIAVLNFLDNTELLLSGGNCGKY